MYHDLGDILHEANYPVNGILESRHAFIWRDTLEEAGPLPYH